LYSQAIPTIIILQINKSLIRFIRIFYQIYQHMSKKDYILKVLDALTGYRPLARGLKILVDGNALDDTTIDSIVDIFAKTINELQDSEAKTKLQKSKDILEKLKTIEREQHLHDQKSLDTLDEMIKEI